MRIYAYCTSKYETGGTQKNIFIMFKACTTWGVSNQTLKKYKSGIVELLTKYRESLEKC